MKKLLLILTCLFSLNEAFAQTEFSISLNSGLFSFDGKSAESTSFMIVGNGNNYTNNPYGTKNGLIYGLSANAKNVFAKHFLLGLDFGYEMMSSKIDINSVFSSGVAGSSSISAVGETKLKTQLLNFHPNFGYRFGNSKTTFDLTAGMDVGFILKATEDGEATTTTTNVVVTTSRDRKNLKTDFRPRMQLTANYQKYGIYVGYSYGLSNYQSGMIGGGPREANSRAIRFGIFYKLK